MIIIYKVLLNARFSLFVIYFLKNIGQLYLITSSISIVQVSKLRFREINNLSKVTKLEHCCCCCYVASVVSDSVRPHRRQPTRLPRPWDSPGKNTGVSCHSLLQCVRVKSESEVAQSCLTLSDPMDCSLPGSSVHGIFQAKVLEWGAIAFSKTRAQGVLWVHIAWNLDLVNKELKKESLS